MTEPAPPSAVTSGIAAPGGKTHKSAKSRVILFLLIYVVLHIFLQWLSDITDQKNTVSIWYPVAGLSFAMIVYYGRIAVFFVFLAIMASHLLTGDARIPVYAILPYAVAVPAITYVWRNLFIRAGIIGVQLAQTPRWAGGLMLMALLSATSNTILGETLLYASGIVSAADLFTSSMQFLTGDLIGIMSVAPLLTLAVFPAFSRFERNPPVRPWRWQRGLIIYTIIGAVGLFLLLKARPEYQLRICYLGALPILYAAIRGRVRETCLAIFVLTVFLAFALALADKGIVQDMPLFLILMMAVAYIVATAVSTNRSITKSLAATLEQRDLLTSEQQKLNAQMSHLRSMESLGTLAGGMAHELNNLLQPILTFAKATETASDSERKTYLERIRDCTLAAKSLVQDVLTFARSGNLASAAALETKAAADIFRAALALARKAVPASIAIREDHDASEMAIRCVPAQLVQILINLFRNAVDAKAKSIALSSCLDLEKGHVILSVTDDGLGMDSETLSRALEPFFTTKQIGRGTGLGLSVVYGIMKSWNGEMHIESTAGQGTRINLHFPVIIPDS